VPLPPRAAHLPRAQQGLELLQQGALGLARAAQQQACGSRASPQVVYDFDEFMSIPTCTVGRHCGDAEASGYAKLAK
jgi:hypothetical protein